MRTLLGLSAFVIFAACAPTAAPPAPSGPAGKMEHAMGNCPAAVTGAVTSMRTISGGLELDITATTPEASNEIVRRAHHDSVAGPPDPSVGAHTGQHGGPGDGGHCPVIHAGTKVSVMEIGGGVRITVLAEDPAQTSALIADTRARLEWLDPANRR